MSSSRGPSSSSLPNELWQEVLYYTTFVPYEVDIWAKAHVRLHFRKMPLHLTTGAIPKVYETKYSLCLSLMRVSTTWQALATPLLYSFAVIYGDEMLEKFVDSVDRRPSLLRYIKGLILLPASRTNNSSGPQYSAALDLIERLPNLRILHQPGVIVSDRAHYQHSLISMDSYFCHQLSNPQSALQNLRALTISTGCGHTPVFSSGVTLPALVALDVSSLDDLEDLAMFQCIARWKMPILGILSASTSTSYHVLLPLFRSVSHCLRYLQLKCPIPIWPSWFLDIKVPNLRELIFIIDFDFSGPIITHSWFIGLYPLPSLRTISITQNPEGNNQGALQQLLSTLEYVIKMEGKPPQLETVRVWEEGHWGSGLLVDPAEWYLQLAEYEERNAFGGAELKVVMPDSGVYESPTTAYPEVALLYGGEMCSDSEDYESCSDDTASDGEQTGTAKT